MLENNNILIQILFLKINNSRDNAVHVLEKVAFFPVTVNIFMGSDFYQVGCQANKLKTKIMLTN